MRKYAETSHANKGYKLAIVVFISNSVFSKKKLGSTFQTLFAQKRDLPYPYVLYENESLQHFLSFGLRKMATFLVLEVRFFQGIQF